MPPRLLRAPAAVAAIVLALAGAPVRSGGAEAQAAGAPSAAPGTAPAPPAEGVVLRLERALGAGRSAASASTPVYARAERIDGSFGQTCTLQGSVELRHGGTVVRGDRVVYEFKDDLAKVRGHARLADNGAVFEGPSLDFRLEAHTGQMPDASYSYAAKQGHGQSKLIEFLGDDDIRMHGATYTTCRPDDPAWWIKAETLDIDRLSQEAVGHSTTLYFEGVPVLTSPWFDMPLGDQRRSGILTPGFYQNSRLGQEFIVPWYWNIAPNRDYTLTPDLITRRGILLGNEFRFLEPRVRGLLQLDLMPNDRTTGTTREHVSLQQEFAAQDGVTGALNYNRVSDDNYLVDFSHNIVSASPSVLPQEARLSYGQTYWNGTLQIQKSQVLTSLLAGVAPPYQRIPDLSLNAARVDWHGLDVSNMFDATRFEQSGLESGTRYVLNPSISYPWLAPGWFAVPKVQWHYTEYELDPAYHGGQTGATRSLPIASLDAGLVFERSTSWGGSAMTQTLEPRVFYAYAPFRDQSGLPNFDSADADFNFAQLFTENTFTGNDRIAQADQLTTAVVSRYLDDATGAERLRVALGQRYYFGSQLVTLPGEQPRTNLTSDVLFAASATPAREWTADLGLDYSTLQSQFVKASVGVRWHPRAASVLNFSYRYQTGVLEQVGVSAQWPLSPRWYGVGSLNYSIAGQGWIETVGGFEYKADCWVGRFVVQRYSVTLNNYTTTWFFQVELNGLTSVGTSPLDQLQRSIPGFQRINPPAAAPGPYDNYE